MTKILIVGYYGLGNIGDEVILSGMINSLKKFVPDPHFSVITNFPEETQSLHKVRPIQQSFKKGVPTFLKKIIFDREMATLKHEIQNCDIFILGGGSLLQDLKVHYLPIILSLVKIAQEFKKKTVIYGIGAGPITTYLGQKICKNVLNNADLVTVRDSISKIALENCKVQNVVLTADPAFAIDLPDRDTVNHYLRLMNLNDGDHFISCTAYNWLHDSDRYCNPSKGAPDLQHRREQFAKILESITVRYDKSVLFIPTVKIDHEGYTAIRNCMSVPMNGKVLDYNSHFNAVFAALSCSDVLIGMRLHSIILATICEVPVVPVSYCGKVRSFIEQIGLDEMYLDIEDLGSVSFAEQLSKNFDTIWTNRAGYAEKQRIATENLRQKALMNAKMVANLVNEAGL